MSFRPSFFMPRKYRTHFVKSWHMAWAFTLVSSLFAFNLATSAWSGVPSTALPALQPEPAPLAPEKADRQTASAEISGSPWPGIIDHLLQRPLPDEAAAPGKPGIHINYPSIGDARIDADIRHWVGGIAQAFESHLDMERAAREYEEGDNLAGFYLDDDLNSGVATQDGGPEDSFELWGNYKISRPSDSAISIIFELWNYAGGDGNLDIVTLNYNLLSGQRLGIADIFEKPDVALELMSKWSRDKLGAKLGVAQGSRMLQDGTEPLAENFSSLTLTPTGICINFQPYQVAPWDTGIQKIAMPLDALSPSEPLLALWGKQ